MEYQRGGIGFRFPPMRLARLLWIPEYFFRYSLKDSQLFLYTYSHQSLALLASFLVVNSQALFQVFSYKIEIILPLLKQEPKTQLHRTPWAFLKLA